MKACQKCHEKNQESNTFCHKCGAKLSEAQFRGKKEKVLGEKKQSSRTMISLLLVAVALGGLAYWIIQGSAPANSGALSQPKVSGNVDYAGQKIAMADVQPTVGNGKISIPIDLVLNKRLVRFEYEANGNKVPLLAYITQTGKLVTAVSMCEPCRSTRFHIQAKTLVCNACGTQWTLDTLKGISGGCLNYPPDVIPSTVDKGLIQIDQKTVTQWKPRV